jgi:hypothetical protein
MKCCKYSAWFLRIVGTLGSMPIGLLDKETQTCNLQTFVETFHKNNNGNKFFSDEPI